MTSCLGIFPQAISMIRFDGAVNDEDLLAELEKLEVGIFYNQFLDI